jgi:hypothetical protein
MPQASGAGGGAGAWMDHDAVLKLEAPPVINQWYTVFHDYNVRLIWCTLMQYNDETAVKNLEIRWTIEGTVYFTTVSAVESTEYYIYRNTVPSTGGTDGLGSTTDLRNAAFYVDKRGLDFLVEIRITSALGTNQVIAGTCVYETAAPMI